jgi:hypothetical protein
METNKMWICGFLALYKPDHFKTETGFSGHDSEMNKMNECKFPRALSRGKMRYKPMARKPEKFILCCKKLLVLRIYIV